MFGVLEPANLLIDEHNQLVVADFGISQAVTNTVTSTQVRNTQKTACTKYTVFWYAPPH